MTGCERSWCLILAAAVVLSGCGFGGAEEEHGGAAHRRVDEQGRVVLTQEERAALGLETASAALGSLTPSTLRFGKVVARPDEDALVSTPITGRLEAPAVALGATVEVGEVLLVIEPLVDAASRASLEAQRRELLGQIEGARAQVQAKQADLSRIVTLVRSGLATEAERAQAEAALASERARVESLQRAAAELAGTTGGRLELPAPAAGVVAMLATEAGSTIAQGTVVARIVRAGPRWIDVAVPPGDPVGSAYQVQGVAGPVAARLLMRGAVVQADGTRRDRLEAASTAAPSLPPGATVPVEVLHEVRGLVVPVIALVRRGRETLVFVENEADHFAPSPVQVAARNGSRAVVASGLSPGDRVVTLGASSLLGELGAQGFAQRGAEE